MLSWQGLFGTVAQTEVGLRTILLCIFSKARGGSSVHANLVFLPDDENDREPAECTSLMSAGLVRVLLDAFFSCLYLLLAMPVISASPLSKPPFPSFRIQHPAFGIYISALSQVLSLQNFGSRSNVHFRLCMSIVHAKVRENSSVVTNPFDWPCSCPIFFKRHFSLMVFVSRIWSVGPWCSVHWLLFDSLLVIHAYNMFSSWSGRI